MEAAPGRAADRERHAGRLRRLHGADRQPRRRVRLLHPLRRHGARRVPHDDQVERRWADLAAAAGRGADHRSASGPTRSRGAASRTGIAGARADLAAMPWVDIANGAPTGADATNEIVDTWVDGKFGLNNESTMLVLFDERRETWSTPTPISQPGDSPAYTAPAISPERHKGLRRVTGVHAALPDDHGRSPARARRLPSAADRGGRYARRLDDGLYGPARRCSRIRRRGGSSTTSSSGTTCTPSRRALRRWCVERRSPHGGLSRNGRLAPGSHRRRARGVPGAVAPGRLPGRASATTTSSARPQDRSQARDRRLPGALPEYP